jgi:HTH-type transcriptional regulator/antitoxin HigA
MKIRPIREKADHSAAIKRIASLMGAQAGTPESDELEILVTLVDAYEDKHHAIAPPDPVSAILFRMEQQELSRRDLEPLIGSRARVSEILGRKRNLTLPMIRRLRSGLNISADILIKPQTSSSTRAKSTRATGRG